MQQLHFELAERYFTESMRLAERYAGRDSISVALCAPMIGQIWYEQGRLDEAETLVAGLMSVIDVAVLLDSVLIAYRLLIRIAAARSDVGQAYALLDLARGPYTGPGPELTTEMFRDWDSAARNSVNDFEAVIRPRHREIDALLARGDRHGFFYRMSGSGSTVFKVSGIGTRSLDADAKLPNEIAEVRNDEVMRERIVTGGHGRVRGEHAGGCGCLESCLERQTLRETLAQKLENEKGGVSLVQMPDRGSDPDRSQRAQPADPVAIERGRSSGGSRLIC